MQVDGDDCGLLRLRDGGESVVHLFTPVARTVPQPVAALVGLVRATQRGVDGTWLFRGHLPPLKDVLASLVADGYTVHIHRHETGVRPGVDGGTFSSDT